MATTDTTFDVYAGVYVDTVNDSVRFGGRDVEFYARAKVRALREIAGGLDTLEGETTVLDVGCGAGITDSFLLPHVGSVHGVDVSAEMVSAAAQRNPTATYELYDGGRLPFEDGRFDLVFAACVLHHVPPADWSRFLAELWRVTAKRGVAVIIEHNPANPLTRKAVRACPFDEDATLARPRHVAATLLRLGVRRVERRYMTFLPIDRRWAQRIEDSLGWLPAGAQYMVTARQ